MTGFGPHSAAFTSSTTTTDTTSVHALPATSILD